MGQHGAHLGPVGPRWAPCWPHESCYQGRQSCSTGWCFCLPLLLDSNHNKTARCVNIRVLDFVWDNEAAFHYRKETNPRHSLWIACHWFRCSISEWWTRPGRSLVHSILAWPVSIHTHINELWLTSLIIKRLWLVRLFYVNLETICYSFIMTTSVAFWMCGHRHFRAICKHCKLYLRDPVGLEPLVLLGISVCEI